MALYKYSNFLAKSDDAIFDELHSPAELVPHSGIYRCIGCGREAVCNVGDPLPPQNHHQHSLLEGSIFWQLVVW